MKLLRFAYEQAGLSPRFQVAPEAAFRPPGTLCPQREQPLAVLLEINQGEGRRQPFMVLPESAVARWALPTNNPETKTRGAVGKATTAP